MTDQTRTVRAACSRVRTALVVSVAMLAASCGHARSAPPVVLPTNAEPSVIHAADGSVLTVLRNENRRSVPLEAIPSTMQDAIVAIEDSRFWTHSGVDPQAIVRAAGRNAEEGTVAEGGSTITQQYVKTALLSPEQTLGRKIEEASIALAIERAYSKQLILELYLNTIFFGNRAYGVAAAAEEYFGVQVEDLSLPQAALLAGIVQAPARHDPRVNPDSALQRRNLVLRRMVEQNLITAAQGEAAAAEPLGVVEESGAGGVTRYRAPHFVDEVKKWLLYESDALGDTVEERTDRLMNGGLRIDTTLDPRLQNDAEEAIASVLKDQGTDPRMPDAALVSIEPRNGFVRAMVGGHDYFGTHSYRQSNLATGAGRHPGSAFKPVVMAAALEAGVSPSKRFNAPPSATFRIPGGVWPVKGGGIGSGNMTECMVVSSNTCYANIVLDPAVGAEKGAEMARKLGVVSTTVEPNPSLVLGAVNATVQDMASVYATFANDGVNVPPVLVTKITAADGSVIYQHQHLQRRAMSPASVRVLAPALEGVISSGTGKRAAIGRPAGGKTGSAQNNTDAWFCGYTQQLATAVWVGFAEPRPDRNGVRRLVPMTRPNTRMTVFGGDYPAQIWAAFMSRALQDVEPTPLVDPLTTPPPTTTVPQPDDGFKQFDSTEQTFAEVPEVEGLDASAARSRLRRAGFDVETLIVRTEFARDSVVLSQSPAPGASVRAGSTVVIEVSELPPPPTTEPPPVEPPPEEPPVTTVVPPSVPPSTSVPPGG